MVLGYYHPSLTDSGLIVQIRFNRRSSAIGFIPSHFFPRFNLHELPPEPSFDTQIAVSNAVVER